MRFEARDQLFAVHDRHRKVGRDHIRQSVGADELQMRLEPAQVCLGAPMGKVQRKRQRLTGARGHQVDVELEIQVPATRHVERVRAAGAILVGPAAKINAVAREHHLDISRFKLVDAAHSEEAAAKAVALIREGRGELLMKGSLHTDELMRQVTSGTTGLRTARRISHVFIMDVPTYAETLFITDAAINIFPDLDTALQPRI